jgi:hypothetical protein
MVIFRESSTECALEMGKNLPETASKVEKLMTIICVTPNILEKSR